MEIKIYMQSDFFEYNRYIEREVFQVLEDDDGRSFPRNQSTFQAMEEPSKELEEEQSEAPRRDKKSLKKEKTDNEDENHQNRSEVSPSTMHKTQILEQETTFLKNQLKTHQVK